MLGQVETPLIEPVAVFGEKIPGQPFKVELPQGFQGADAQTYLFWVSVVVVLQVLSEQDMRTVFPSFPTPKAVLVLGE